MTTIGSLGIGSGLDLNGLMDKLTAAEQQPLNAIKTRQSAYNTKLSAYGVVQSLLSTFQSAAKKLSDPAFMGAFKSSSTAPDVLGASADTTAVPGSYSVSVTRLAQAQSLVSAGVASTSTGIGSAAASITVDFGAVTGSLDAATGTYNAGATFQADATKTPISLTLGSGKTSLAEVRDAINKAAGGTLSASIVNDGSSNHLVLSSNATGQKSSMRVTVDAGNPELQALLGNDPAGVQALRQTADAHDAALTVNGIAVTSASNTVASSIQGVSLALAATGSSVVKVERNSAAVQGAINDFVTAYNSLNSKLKDLSAYNADKKIGAVLLGDATVRIIQSRLRATMTEARAGSVGDPTLLSDIGVAFQKDGSLVVTAAKLTAALTSNPDGLARLFTGMTLDGGLASGISRAVDEFTGSDGLLKLASNGASSAVKRLDSDYTAMQDRIDAKLARYRAQFQQLDSVMSGLTATSNYLTQQFANKSK